MAEQVPSIVVLISGNGSNLQAIIDQCASGAIPGNVVKVISNKADAFGLQRAADAGIATQVISHKDYDSREAYDAELQASIDACSPSLVVLAGFMRILSEGFVRHYQGKMLNIHPSLLPKFKGLHTHQRAIEEGESEHGATVHFVTPELDGGPIIIQSKVPVFEDDSASDLASRVQEQELRIYPLVVKWFCQGRLHMNDKGVCMDGEQIPELGYAPD